MGQRRKRSLGYVRGGNDQDPKKAPRWLHPPRGRKTRSVRALPVQLGMLPQCNQAGQGVGSAWLSFAARPTHRDTLVARG